MLCVVCPGVPKRNINRHVTSLFADEDECTTGSHSCNCGGLVGCTASCTNNDGSYSCGCSAGFTLGADGITCVGE